MFHIAERGPPASGLSPLNWRFTPQATDRLIKVRLELVKLYYSPWHIDADVGVLPIAAGSNGVL